MTLIGRGRVRGGRLVFDRPLDLPDDTEVLVSIDPVLPNADGAVVEAGDGDALFNLPFFGMWADREDARDSAAWVRKARAGWYRRASRPA